MVAAAPQGFGRQTNKPTNKDGHRCRVKPPLLRQCMLNNCYHLPKSTIKRTKARWLKMQDMKLPDMKMQDTLWISLLLIQWELQLTVFYCVPLSLRCCGFYCYISIVLFSLLTGAALPGTGCRGPGPQAAVSGTSGVNISVRRGRGAVGVEGVGCDGGGWAPSPEKINKKSFLSPKW